MDIIINFLYDWGYLALFICMALENMNVPIPSEIILGFAGFLVSQEIFSSGLPLPSGRLPALLVPSLPTTWATKADADSY